MNGRAGFSPQKSSSRGRHALFDKAAAGEIERPLVVTEPPVIKGPYPVEGNPSLAEYEIVARLSLPAPDTEVVPSVEVHEDPEEGECIDVRWTTDDPRAPRGVWERSAVVTIPRQFAIAAYAVTGEAPLLEREAGA